MMGNKKVIRHFRRFRGYDYSRGAALFITIVTNPRRRLFGKIVDAKLQKTQLGLAVERRIIEMGQMPGIRLFNFVVMPDHVHLILRIESDMDGQMISAPTVSTVVGSMKRWVSRQAGRPIWQKSFYDHGIRNQQDYNEIWEYIENNPPKYALKRTP